MKLVNSSGFDSLAVTAIGNYVHGHASVAGAESYSLGEGNVVILGVQISAESRVSLPLVWRLRNTRRISKL